MRENAKILVVDDEESIRDIVTQFFEQSGCRVSSAGDGQEGIDRATQSPFDLIFLDLNMPNVTGMEALPKLREVNPNARIVIMTAFASYESKVEAREKGAYDYVLKPINLSKMKEVAEKALPDRRQSSGGPNGGRIDRVTLDPAKTDRDVAKLIPERMARAFCLIAIQQSGRTVTIAMADPFDIVALDTLKTHLNYDIRPVQGDREEITKTIEEVYGERIDVDNELLDLVSVEATEDEMPEEKSATELNLEADAAPVVKIVNLILLRAAQSRASDIHIEPGEKAVSVRLRIDGVLHDIAPPPKSMYSAVVSRIKILANMDIAEHRVPQDGRARMKFEGKDIDLRVNTLPTVYGEKVVLRLLDKGNLLTDIKMLGLDDFNTKMFLDAIKRPFGMVYLTGPTGSGKTTTLYSALGHVKSREVNIVTVEEPVEYELEGINQVPVHTEIGMTFAAALRAILRQDPDIIMLGETRDLETAEIAVRAALTGHLVFSTLHTNDAPSSITRLIDMGIAPFLVCSALNLVVAQRLVRRICKECKIEAPPPDEVIQRFLRNSKTPLPEKLYRGAGCETCKGTGYKGRLAVHQLLSMTSELKRIVMRRGTEEEIWEAAAAMGCKTLMECGLWKASEGLTTLDEVMKVAIAEE
jgi:type IV pilus assembly protein PilB